MPSPPNHGVGRPAADPDELLARLVTVGPREDVTATDVRPAFPEFSGPDGRKTYAKVTGLFRRQSLTPVEMTSLLRTMVLCEADFSVGGGSPSIVSPLFARLARRDPDAANRLAGWIIEHRSSHWIPWGSLSSARTLAERQLEIDAQAAAWERHEREQEEQRRAAAARRLTARERQETHTKAAAAARPTRAARVTRLLESEDLVRAHSVIRGRETLDYWPAVVAAKCRRVIGKLEKAELELLLRKARRTPSEPWRELRPLIRDELQRRTTDTF